MQGPFHKMDESNMVNKLVLSPQLYMVSMSIS
jgi:hypothetical protein